MGENGENFILLEQKQSKNKNCEIGPEKTDFVKINDDSHDKNGTAKNDEFEFKIPLEAPVFVPTLEEFKNPLAYISKIRQKAEKYGICKIKPPSTWQPPFTVDVDKLRFTPRVQRLNELEAKTRIKLNFLDQIAKFWELQGSSLKIPMVERKALDLYSLHRIVQEEGGLELTTRERKWSKIASRMGYPHGKNIGTNLKSHYERILYPYDVFTTGKVVDLKLECELDTEDHDYKPHSIAARQALKPPTETTARRSKRFTMQTTPLESNSNENCSTKLDFKLENKWEEVDDIKSSNDISRERRKLQIHGAGPKMAGAKLTKTPDTGNKSFRSNSNSNITENKTLQSVRIKNVDDPLAKYICHICTSGDVEEAMLLCDGCDDSYHTFCLMPPLTEIPKGEWRCPKCVVEEVSKPVEAFGFEQAQREYTLQQFGEMADQFKSDYFNMPVHLVPTELVEKEFWRIVSSIDEDVTVEYGADLHTMDHGSGFPTKSSLYLLPGDQEYAESSWNLNNLPVLEESILGHINADISGMKVPWMYVGMCFATFCWHNEDHWSYSINYLHWGEPKTWYGVPGNNAEAFENTMKSAAPELFESQPDLLHQLVTIMNPNILMAAGVPVCRTDQHAGEFIITFPRAYHAGFNQGYNFAEAVNFAPADWLQVGRECINHYSLLRRFCVFSHDELVCKMALEPDKLNSGIATACYLDMAEMVDCEKKLRKSLLEWGVTKADREAFELLPDDERQCEVCKTTCFLSAVTCTCSSVLTCLRHYTALCQCSPEKHTLKYRYTLDELPLMLRKLKVKAESFENWLTRVRNVLDPNTPTNITLDDLQDLAHEAEDKRFPSSILLERLNSAVLEAEKCVTVIQQLDINKIRTRTRNSNSETSKYKLTMDELDMFVQEIDNLCCIIQEGNSVRELQQMGHEFVKRADLILEEICLNQIDVQDMHKCIEIGASLCIELPQVITLKDRLKQVQWYQMCTQLRDFAENNKHPTLSTLKKIFDEGMELTPYPSIEKELAEIQSIIVQTEEWEICAKQCFENGTQHQLPEIETLIDRADIIFCILPSLPQLRDALKKSKEWLTTVEILQSNENYPYFNTLENVVSRGKNIPFQLEELKRMDEYLNSARNWKDRTCRTFLRKNTLFTLMDALSPRADAIMIPSRQRKKLSGEKIAEKFTEELGPVQMVIAFKQAEEKEMRDMRNLREVNINKNPEKDNYCICKRSFCGIMYNCQLCKDWFHSTCVPTPKNTVRQRPPGAVVEQPSFVLPSVIGKKDREEDKYLCPSCMRSRRPRLETILSLLVSLQRLPLRLPEGEALQCLTERAMNWQDRARQALSSDDVASTLARLSMISQKSTETDVNKVKPNQPSISDVRSKNAPQILHKHKKRKKRNTNISPVPAKLNDNAVEKQKIKTILTTLTSTITSSDSNYNTEEEDLCDRINNKDYESSNSSPSPTNNEHAYSVPPLLTSQLSPNSTSFCTPSIMNEEGSLLTDSLFTASNSSRNQKIDLEPLITLNNVTKLFLENLMMEGDLLEVSLDETQHLWRILNATKTSTSDLAYIQNKYTITNTSSNEQLLVNSIKSSAVKKRKNDDSHSGSSASLVVTNTTSKKDIKHQSDANILTPLNINTTSTKAVDDDEPISPPSPKPKQRLKRGRKIRPNFESTNFVFEKKQINSDIFMGLNNSTSVTTNTSRKRNVSNSMKGRKNTSNPKKVQQSRSTATETTTSDDEDECSATNCAKPTGTEVDWVQCDGGCNKWFHMHCVGLNKSQIKPDDDFICKNCRKSDKPMTVTSNDGSEFTNLLSEHKLSYSSETPNENNPMTAKDKVLDSN